MLKRILCSVLLGVLFLSSTSISAETTPVVTESPEDRIGEIVGFDLSIKNTNIDQYIFKAMVLGEADSVEWEFYTAENKLITKEDGFAVSINHKLNNVFYKYRCRAYILDESGNKIYSDWTKCKLDSHITNIKRVKYSKKYITVAWQKNIGATKYKVEISRKQNTKYKTLKITTKRKMKIKGLKKGTRYYIRITPITNISGNTYNGAAAVYETSTKRM